MHNILLDPLPTSVTIRGVEYPINTGFRTSILFELMIGDKKVSAEAKMIGMLRLYYPTIPEDREEAVNKILWFYNCGQEKKKKEEDDRNKTAKDFRPQKAIYSFEKDAMMIYAAFRSQYGIDLNEADMHWWKFSALFSALDENQQISKVMGIRALDDMSGMSKKQKKRMNELKKQFSLSDNDPGVSNEVKLAQRDAKMKEYAKRRIEEVSHGGP